MTKDDYPQFRELLAGVYAMYRVECTRVHLDIWWRAFQGHDLAALSEALSRHLMNPDTGQYLPKPADAVRMMGGTTQDAALQAWAKVDRAVRVVGTWNSVVFDDPLIHRVIDEMGGWPQLGNKQEKEWPFIAKEFENRYRGYKLRGERPDYPRRLIGSAEHGNSHTGHQTPDGDVALIGASEACRRVMSGGQDVQRLPVNNMAALLRGPLKQLESKGGR